MIDTNFALLALEAWLGACVLMALVWLAVSIHLAGKE
jgi:hypothetical protein